MKRTVAKAWGPAAMTARASQVRQEAARSSCATRRMTGMKQRLMSRSSTRTIWLAERFHPEGLTRLGRKNASTAQSAAASVMKSAE